MIEKLPHIYLKEKLSNISDVFEVIKSEVENLNDERLNVEKQDSIDNAKNVTLDKHGEIVGQNREGRNDVAYRKVIKVRLKANLSGGDIPTINEVGEVLVGESYLGVSELYYQDKYDNEPAAVAVALDYEKAFEEISKEYEDIDNDPWYLDGEYLLDGERLLDGGINFDLSARLDDIYSLLGNIKSLMREVVAGGVRVYVELPDNIDVELPIEHQMLAQINNLINQTIEINYSSQQIINNQTEQSAVNLLDGSMLSNGEYLLDGNRDTIIHNVEIQEVVA